MRRAAPALLPAPLPALLSALLPASVALIGCAPEGGDVCDRASAQYGDQVCLTEIPDRDAWESVTVDAQAVDQIRTGKYVVPARADAPLPALFADAGTFPLHQYFFRDGFPEFYRGLTMEDYARMVISAEDRVYFSGSISEYRIAGGSFFGAVIWDDPTDLDGTITCAQAAAVLAAIQPLFPIGEIRFVPSTDAQREASDGWDGEQGCGVPVGRPPEVGYEVYTPGEAYGTIRMLDLTDLPGPGQPGGADFGYQDVLVLDQAPFDLDRVVSGVITGTRQGALSHLNVRSAARGTVNAYLADPRDALAAWADQLVHLTCDPDGYAIEAADPADALAFWEALRPDPLEIAAPDRTQAEFHDLLDLPVATPAERDLAARAYGSKGSNLARLYQGLPARYRLRGFVVPIDLSLDHLEAATWADPADGQARTLADSLARWHADPAFRADGDLRRARLAALRAAILAAPLLPGVEAALTARVAEVFGPGAPVRLRSSSNAEDAPGFSGAGLYTSLTSCAPPCSELPLADALRGVWASLWADAAWEEREWYGIDHLRAGMGVLVNDQSEDERANIVAFSHSPLSEDSRQLVEAQAGDLDVVSADPGVFPEQIFLSVTGSGDDATVEIERYRRSSETDVWILTDAGLEDLGRTLAEIEGWYLPDDPIPDGHTLIWDTEWKVLSDGRLIIKQIRPWLRAP